MYTVLHTACRMVFKTYVNLILLELRDSWKRNAMHLETHHDYEIMHCEKLSEEEPSCVPRENSKGIVFFIVCSSVFKRG
jgi:hypothetical protein